jgi:hypothetical protein
MDTATAAMSVSFLGYILGRLIRINEINTYMSGLHHLKKFDKREDSFCFLEIPVVEVAVVVAVIGSAYKSTYYFILD